MIPQGEWRVMNSGDPENVTALIVDAKGYRIARAYPSRNGQETVLARARLIAVAPKMAALLADYCVAHTAMARYLFADLSNSKQCQCDLCQRWRALLARIEEEEG